MARRKGSERWRGIPGCPHYQVSDRGRVRSLDRWMRVTYSNGKSRNRFLRGKLLSPGTDGKHSHVWIGSKPQRCVRVHLLVLLAFRGPPPKGLEGCHDNGNGHDNRLGNLRYDTRRGNQLDRVRHGTSNRGERHGMSKLTEKDIKAIRRSRLNGVALAGKYGVSEGRISLILSRKTWAWLP